MFRTIALAATAAALLASPALAAQYRIPTQNLHTPEGASAFDTKLRHATRALCQDRQGSARAQCIEAVRIEALGKLPQVQQLAYLQARTGNQVAPVQMAPVQLASVR